MISSISFKDSFATAFSILFLQLRTAINRTMEFVIESRENASNTIQNIPAYPKKITHAALTPMFVPIICLV